jgi:glyoxylase-like metal-dependent hydrolase (beta-lactamase superfamily II)
MCKLPGGDSPGGDRRLVLRDGRTRIECRPTLRGVLTEIADGVLVHESAFLQSNAVVVQGSAGVVLIDPGIDESEMLTLAADIRPLGQPVVAGFATHPHWDHVLWHAAFGTAPRYGTVRCAADMQDLMADTAWKDRVAEVLPPDIADNIPMELFGDITGLPAGTNHIPWDGPRVRILAHQAHAAGHAALLIEDSGVLVAGDMVSDILIPFLELDADDPVGDYVAGLQLLAGMADNVKSFVPGHGSIGDADELRARIELDSAYVESLRDPKPATDPRIQPSAPNGEWLPGVHEWQRQQIQTKTPRQ